MTLSTKKYLFIMFAAVLATATITYFLTVGSLNNLGHSGAADSATSSDDPEPLYWVAPMDPNFKRDKPGKSPMGMDLIPVYAEEAGGIDEGVGTIRISPDVVNNLGVRTETVAPRVLNTEITTVGYVQYDEDQLVHVHPRVEGWIETLFVKAEGDPVEAGAPLYQLYSPPLVNAQEELLLAIERGNPTLIQAAEERLKALQIDGQVIEDLKRTGNVQQQITFYAPMSGVVDNLNIREGFYVQPGTTLLSIGSLDQVWVEAEVFERQAGLVELGLPVQMTLGYLPGRQWQGEVDYIYPSLNSQTRTLPVRLQFDNADGVLKPNMYAQVVIRAASDTPVLSVPSDAVIRTGNQDRVVLALGEGYYKSVAVDLGRVTPDYTEILGGLNDGELVVTSAQFLIDSESSKTSDFKRLHHGQSDSVLSTDSATEMTMESESASNEDNAQTAWVAGEIKSVTPESRVVSAYHEPIPNWQWPSMTMNFFVAESVDISQLEAGTLLHMELGPRDDGQYEIHSVHIMSQPQSVDHQDMDHSQHQMMQSETD